MNPQSRQEFQYYNPGATDADYNDYLTNFKKNATLTSSSSLGSPSVNKKPMSIFKRIASNIKGGNVDTGLLMQGESDTAIPYSIIRDLQGSSGDNPKNRSGFLLAPISFTFRYILVYQFFYS